MRAGKTASSGQAKGKSQQEETKDTKESGTVFKTRSYSTQQPTPITNPVPINQAQPKNTDTRNLSKDRTQFNNKYQSKFKRNFKMVVNMQIKSELKDINSRNDRLQTETARIQSSLKTDLLKNMPKVKVSKRNHVQPILSKSQSSKL